MQSRRIIIATSIPLALVLRPVPANAIVKGKKSPSTSCTTLSYNNNEYSSPLQYDIEGLLIEVSTLNNRMIGMDLAIQLLAFQVMITGIFCAMTRK